MAYQTRGRDPLFDSNMQAAIERRGRELLGVGLVCLGVMAALMIGSYTPEDPSWLSATDAPVQNWMGRMGASIAAPLFMIVGWGAWGLAIVLAVWGLRFAVHQGADRALGRMIFAPIWIALAAVYASGQTIGPDWTHSFGLGGLFGDMVLGSMLSVIPVGANLGLKVLMLLLGAGLVLFGAFVLGFTSTEVKRTGRFLLVGLVMTYATLMAFVGRGASASVRAAAILQANHAERRARRAAEAEEAAAWAAAEAEAQALVPAPMPPSMPPSMPMPAAKAAAKPSLLSRMPSLIKRPDAMPEPELVELPTFDEDETQAFTAEDDDGADRIRTKITNVIKSRVRQSPSLQVKSVAPLTRGRGRGPVPLILDTTRGLAVAPEPPLTAQHAARMTPANPPRLGSALDAGAVSGAVSGAGANRLMPNAPEIREGADTYAEAGYQPEAEHDPDLAQAPPLPEPEIDDSYAFEMPPEDIAPQFRPQTAPIPVAEPRRVVQQPLRKPVQPSRRAQAEAQPQLEFEDNAAEFELPPLSLLLNPETITRYHLSDEALEQNARMLESVLDDYGVKGEIVSVRPGPVVTMYELEPAPGLKASRVIGLADDIARSMSALSARVSTVPGRSVIGIELPNDNREMVGFREILSSRDYGDGTQKLPLALGKDIGGDPIVANLAKMPHLLIAGTTGSGKSVAINTMILSLLYKLSPEDCRLIMIDPKMLELSVYDGIPHLLSPVVTDPKKAVVALKWVVGEMEERYRKMSKMGVRNIDGFNGRVADALGKGEMFERTVQTGFDDDTGEPIFESEEIQPAKMPYIVVVVDEMADLMMVAGKEIEACIQRLAQMARASGIHLIMATQRPSVDVITGTIKANFPTRISFQVTSKIDSRTILGEMGAEQLLGMGDMLYMAGGAKIIRCHGPFVSDEEVEEIVNHLKAFGPPKYMSGVVEGPEDGRESDIDAVLGLNTGGNTDGEDALYDTAVAIVVKDRKCSTSYIQRKLAIGYNKAARLVEQMEDEGVVSSANHVGKREILVPEQG